MFIVRFVLRLLATIGMTWLLATYLPQYFTVTGGLTAVIIVGIILAILNMSVRIVLDILTFPLRLFSKIIVLIFVNAALLWFATVLVSLFSETVARFAIQGGFVGWLIASVAFGLLSWLIRTLLREGDGHHQGEVSSAGVHPTTTDSQNH